MSVTAISPPATCLSQTQTEIFQASVFSNSTDITSLVGPITWGVVDGAVGKISTTASGLQSNQVQITASQPGLTHVFATASDFNATGPVFEVCAIRSISLTVTSSGATSVQLPSGASTAITQTAIDSLGNPVSSPNLTLFVSPPGAATVRSGSITAAAAGGAAVGASCAPPTCNINFQPIYSANVVRVVITGVSNTATFFASTTDCGATAGCETFLVPITASSDTAGNPVTVPRTPNSLLFNTSTGFLGTAGGLQQFSLANNTFTANNTIRGKVLAVSPDGKLVAVSDTTHNPNVVNILHTDASTVTPLLLSGVTAAAFSPDSVKAFLVGGSNLYVYSTTEPLRIIPLTAPAADATFLTTGSFGFLAGGASSSVTTFANCNNSRPAAPSDVATISGAATQIASLLDSSGVLAVNSPGITSIPVNTNAVGCPPSITLGTAVFHDFAQGAFTAKQLLISSDGRRAYVISDLPSVLVYEIGSGLITTIPLTGAPTPLSAVLTLQGNALYVGASDGKIHHLDTVANNDVKQISAVLCNGAPVMCKPDLLALRP
jgi:hypothetical protein